MRRVAAALIACALGCGNGPEEPVVQRTILGPEDVAWVERETISEGPVLSGVLGAGQRAELVAEIGGEVRSVEAEVGQRVVAGELLARIDDAAARQTFVAARAAALSARADLDLAEREIVRTQALVEAGALARRDLDVAEQTRAQALAAVSTAESQLATARDQLEATAVTATITGSVAERQVNEGDIVTVGASLFTLLDLSTLRLEANVPVAPPGLLREGAEVVFRVQGWDERDFVGRIQRISPEVDPVTRQVRVLASLPNEAHTLYAGLFAEGRLAAGLRAALVVPIDAVDLERQPPTVKRVRAGRVEEVVVAVGLVDQRNDRVEITAGLEYGQLVLVGEARELPPGTLVEVPAASAPKAGGV